MFEPFVWIFKQENWKQHVKFLGLVPLCILAISAILYLIGSSLNIQYLAAQWSLYILSGIVLCAAPLLVLGYFWELVEMVINREADVVASSVYNGRIKNIYKIELPELDIIKFIWRGFASIVATILMYMPVVNLMIIGMLAVGLTTINVYTIEGYSFGMVGLCILLFLFTPALLWNYAKQNSVIAVWNIRKAIYVIGNYTGQYLINVFLLFVYHFILEFFTALILKLLFGESFTLVNLGPVECIKIGLFLVISYIVMLYNIYVCGYLLGTIAPPDEA